MLSIQIYNLPDRIRHASSSPDYWVFGGMTDEIRPFKILVKEV